MPTYLRAQLAKKADVHIETLRYYEKIRLIPPPERTGNGYRHYPEETLFRLDFIRSAKEVGLTLEEIREFLIMVEGPTLDIPFVTAMINQKSDEIESRIHKLQKIMELLQELKRALHEPPDCPVIRYLMRNMN